MIDAGQLYWLRNIDFLSLVSESFNIISSSEKSKQNDRWYFGRKQNGILRHMPRLHSFTFYICNVVGAHDLSLEKNIQQTWIYIGCENTCSFANFGGSYTAAYSTLFLPFQFDYLDDLSKLIVRQRHIKVVTENFTREATRCHCAKMKKLTVTRHTENSRGLFSLFFFVRNLFFWLIEWTEKHDQYFYCLHSDLDDVPHTALICPSSTAALGRKIDRSNKFEENDCLDLFYQ